MPQAILLEESYGGLVGEMLRHCNPIACWSPGHHLLKTGTLFGCVMEFSLAVVYLKSATQLGGHIRHNKKGSIAAPGNVDILWGIGKVYLLF